MALVRVREKKPAEGTEPIITYVDEAWVDRWPDDFEVVPEPDTETAAVEASGSTQPKADTTDQPPAEPPARGRF